MQFSSEASRKILRAKEALQDDRVVAHLKKYASRTGEQGSCGAAAETTAAPPAMATGSVTPARSLRRSFLASEVRVWGDASSGLFRSGR